MYASVLNKWEVGGDNVLGYRDANGPYWLFCGAWRSFCEELSGNSVGDVVSEVLCP
jgi:hypothetical protein